MTERAAHAVDAVFPRVPMRQWVLSLPHWLRYVLAWDHLLCRAVLAVYVRFHTLVLDGVFTVSAHDDALDTAPHPRVLPRRAHSA